MRRPPVVATLVVLLAVGTMIALGFWQLGRARWKESLLASYNAAREAPPLYGLPPGMATDALAFRRTHILCRIATAPVQIGGVDRQGRTGFRNIVGCALIDGRVIMADLGWNPVGASPVLPAIGRRIEAGGALIPDSVLAKRVLGEAPGATPLLLVVDAAVPGLAPSVPPAIESIPNNHLSYAVQWFLFAAVAALIYLLALRKRGWSRQ